MRNKKVDEEVLFKLLEELYLLNCEDWKRRIIMCMVQDKKSSYRSIKEELIEVPDLLAYRCLKEMIKEKLIERKEENGEIRYSLLDEAGYLAGILSE